MYAYGHVRVTKAKTVRLVRFPRRVRRRSAGHDYAMAGVAGGDELTLTTAADSGKGNHVASDREFVAARSGAFGGDGDRLEGVVVGDHVG